jgi:transposase
MDWLLPQQARIEQALAKRHLAEAALALYDLTSTYFEGRHCPLAKLGHPRDGNKGKLQVVFGLMANAQGCPVAVEVYAGNTSDPKTVSDQVTKLRKRFGLQRVILVGDRGMIASARISRGSPTRTRHRVDHGVTRAGHQEVGLCRCSTTLAV